MQVCVECGVHSRCRGRLWRPVSLGLQSAHGHSDALDERKEHAAKQRREGRRPRARACSEHAAGNRTACNRVPRILLPPHPDQPALAAGEQEAPDGKVAANDRCACLCAEKSTCKTLALCRCGRSVAPDTGQRAISKDNDLTLGEFRNDLPKFHRLPPIAPIAKALPASSMMRQGLQVRKRVCYHGSRRWSTTFCCRICWCKDGRCWRKKMVILKIVYSANS